MLRFLFTCLSGLSSEGPERMIFIRGGAPQGACVLQKKCPENIHIALFWGIVIMQ